MSRKIRIGFIGAGSWGQRKHLPAINYIREHCKDIYDVEIAALCEMDNAVAKRVSEQYKIPKTYSNLEEFAADETLDCYVVVISPKGLKSVVETLYQRRVPIFTEKPPGLTWQEAFHLAESIKVPNVVAFNRRYFPIIDKLKEVLEEMDEIYYVDCNFYRHERYDSKYFFQTNQKSQPPFVIGTAVHGINILEYLFGNITSCNTTKVRVKTNQTDAWLSDLDFNNEIKGRIKILPCSGSHTEWIEIHSQKRSIYAHFCLYGIDYPGKIVVHERGRIREVIDGNPKEPRIVQEGFVGEYLDFFRAIIEHKPTRSNFQNAVNSMRIAEQIENEIHNTHIAR